jgi:hypothetical protein
MIIEACETRLYSHSVIALGILFAIRAVGL